MLRNATRLMAIAAAALLLPRAASADAPQCLSDWSVAAPIVRKEGLATVEQLAAAAKAGGKGDVVQVHLCKSDGKYSYRVTLRDNKGQLRTITIDARKLFDR